MVSDCCYRQTTNKLSQVMPKRELPSSKPDVLNATLSAREKATRSDLSSTEYSVVTLDPYRDSHTRTPTSRKVSNGKRTHFLNTSRTQRSTSQAPRWLSLESRRRRNEMTLSPTSWGRPNRRYNTTSSAAPLDIDFVDIDHHHHHVKLLSSNKSFHLYYQSSVWKCFAN